MPQPWILGKLFYILALWIIIIGIFWYNPQGRPQAQKGVGANQILNFLALTRNAGPTQTHTGCHLTPYDFLAHVDHVLFEDYFFVFRSILQRCEVSIWNLEFQRIFHWEFQKKLILKYARNKKVQSYEIKTLKTKNQRRAHSLSGCANLDSTPLLLGGTGVYCPPQSHYCSWSWNWVYILGCGSGWNYSRQLLLKFSSSSDLLFLKLPFGVRPILTDSRVMW